MGYFILGVNKLERIEIKKNKEFSSHLEKEVFERLNEAGWQVTYEPKKLRMNDGIFYIPDFAIYYNDELYGYVEVVSLNFENHSLLKKIEYAKNIIREYNPFIFMITDGKTIYLYTKERTETIHYFAGPLAFAEEYKIYKGSNK